jgi:hypothetical protein
MPGDSRTVRSPDLADIDGVRGRTVAGVWDVRGGQGVRALTWVVYAAVIAYVAVCVVSLVLLGQDYDLISRLPGAPGPAYLAKVQRMAAVERGVGLLRLLLALGYGAALFGWFRLVRRTVRSCGGELRTVLRHWSFTVWRVGILGFAVLAFFGTRPVDYTSRDALQASLLAIDQRQMALMVARIVVAAVLVVAVWLLRGRVLALLASAPAPVQPPPAPVPVWMPAPPEPAMQRMSRAYRSWRERRQTRVYD